MIRHHSFLDHIILRDSPSIYFGYSPIGLWDSLSGYVHPGIACPAFQASDWLGAFWSSLSGDSAPIPTIIKKMKTFLEIEGKMGPIPQPISSQYRPPQPNTNPKVRRDNAVEKRKRVVPTKRPNEMAVQPPATISKVPEGPENRPPPLEKAPVYKSTPWPGDGKMSGNLFEDRNWLLPPNYLNNDCKKATSPKSTIKEEPKTGKWGEMQIGTRLPLL